MDGLVADPGVGRFAGHRVAIMKDLIIAFIEAVLVVSVVVAAVFIGLFFLVHG